MNTKNWSNVTIISSLCQEPAEISNSELTYSVVEVFETQNISCENVKQNELASWKDNNVYECVQNKNQRCLSLCWVWSIKPTETGLKPTRGLTARRFEEDWLSKSEKESPTCSKNTSRALLGLTVQNDWELQTIDIKTTFLLGEYINKEVFVIPPPVTQILQKDIFGNFISV